MANRIQLAVNDPCHENWENMSPSEKGRFCGSCQKQVIDFTNMSDAQIAQFFKKPSTGSVCGRFMEDQLERDFEIPQKRIPWLKYFFTVALPAFLVSRSAAQESKTAIKGDTTAVVNCDVSQVLMGKIAGPVVATSVLAPPIPKSINGIVLDFSGAPIAGATVIIKGTMVGTAADDHGRFSLTSLPTNGEVVLVVSCIEYKSREIKINSQNRSEFIRVELEKVTLEFSLGVVFVKEVPKKKKIPVIKELAPDSTSKFITSFPNPVIAGNTLTIKCRKMDKGDYSFELINLAGQMVQYKEMPIENEKQTLQLNTPIVKSGTYYLKITNKANRKSFTNKIIIQE